MGTLCKFFMMTGKFSPAPKVPLDDAVPAVSSEGAIYEKISQSENPDCETYNQY